MRNAAVFAPLLLAFGVASPAVAETWDMPTPYGDATFHTVNIRQFAEDVKAKTGGALEITVHSAGSLFPHPEIKNAVRSRQAPIGEFLLSQVRPPYTLGISLEVEAPGVLLVGAVAPDSPAWRAGVRAGDVLELVDGRSPWPDPMAALAPALNGGEPVELTLDRDGERHRVELRPDRR